MGGGSVRAVSESEVERLLPMSACLAATRQAFEAMGAGRARNLPRRRLAAGQRSLAVMAAATEDDGGFFAAKLYTAGPGGARFHVPLWRAQDGEMVALIEADRLGRLRTGAASGVAAEVLARPDAAVLAVIGSGTQAWTQVEAVLQVRAIREVRVFSRRPEPRLRFCRQIAERFGADARAAADGRQCVSGADIVVTVTTASQPVLDGAWLEPGTLVVAAGNNQPGHREVDAAVLARADRIVADDVDDARLECGDLILQLGTEDAGGKTWQDVVGLADVVAGRMPGRNADRDIVLFESQGLAVEDLYAAMAVWRRATEGPA
jgi:alanine dehydrogenase